MADAELEDVTVEESVIFPEATNQGGELHGRSSTRIRTEPLNPFGLYGASRDFSRGPPGSCGY